MFKFLIKVMHKISSKKHHTVIYIDGQNFLHRCAEILIKSGAIQNRQELINIDVRHIFKKFFPNDNLEIRYYGVNKIRQCHDLNPDLCEKSKKFADNLRRIRSNFAKQGIILKDVGQLKIRDTDVCRRCGHTDHKYQEKGVDVGLATDMVKDALLGYADKIVLVSSDIDMLPAVKIIREARVELTYIGFDGSINNALVNNSDNVFRIHNIRVLEAYESTLNFKNNR